MRSYYGVQRSAEYLAHYGVKGMKWGVRKALERGDAEKLKKHYNKANKKLMKLQERANIVVQKQDARGSGKLAGVLAASGAAKLGIAAPLLGKSAKKHMNAADEAWNSYNHLQSEYKDNIAEGLEKATALQNESQKQRATSRMANNLRRAAVGIGAAELVGAGAVGVRGLMQRHRTTTKGHNKAVQKVNDWQKEMDNTFKGTKYGKQKRKPYKDTYSVVTYRSIDGNGNPKRLMEIPGSHLTRDYKGKDKEKFENYLKDDLNSVRSPNTHNESPWSGYETTGEEYFGKKRKKK